jgi:hypothetical protein
MKDFIDKTVQTHEGRHGMDAGGRGKEFGGALFAEVAGRRC